MIQLPRRSVTRFFIPLIDVLTLLFCIFLLMPVFKEGDPDNPDVAARAALQRDLEQKTEELERTRDDLSQALARLNKDALGRLIVRELTVEERDDFLSYYEIAWDPKGLPVLVRKTVKSAADAAALIGQHKLELERKYPNASSRPGLHYVITSRREEYPTREQKAWFGNVSYNIEWAKGGR